MENEYISKDQLTTILNDTDGSVLSLLTAVKKIQELPSADVVEVKHGEWQYDCACDLFNCSQCGDYMARNVYPYCPWCGADMRERKDKC